MPDRNKRLFKRYDVGEVHGQLQFSLDIQVINMSLTGLAIECGFPMPIGERCSFKIHGRDASVQMTADVQWCRREGERDLPGGGTCPVYQVGLDFQEILNEKAREILSFLEENIVVELERRLFGRFRLRDPEVLAFDLSSGFEVRKISLSGMLIESDLMVAPEKGSVLDLEVHEPSLTLATRGRVAYVAPAEDGGARQLGIEFLGLSEADERHLESFIRGLLE